MSTSASGGQPESAQPAADSDSNSDSDSDSDSDAAADAANTAAELPALESDSAEAAPDGDSETQPADSAGSSSSLAVLLVVLGLLLVLLPSALAGYVVLVGRRRRVAGGGAAPPRPLPLPLARNIKELRLSMQLTPRHGYSRPPDAAEEDKLDLAVAAAAEQYRVVRLNSEYNTPGRRQADSAAGGSGIVS